MRGCTSRFVGRGWGASIAARCGRAERGGGAVGLEPLEGRALLFAWTAQEVYLTELVNRARANPAAEATRLGLDLTAGLSAGEMARYGAQEPLALNEFLTMAARAHSQDMADRNFFDHVNPSGQSPTDRAQAAGYGGTAGENIAAGYSTIDDVHRAWMESLGHRKNVLSLHESFDANFHYDEFGAGLAFNAGGTYNHYQTEAFGYPGATHVQYVLGVVFNDSDSNEFYGVGEGASGVRVDVALSSDPATVLGTYTTDAAGNYQIPMGDGSYVVTFTRISDGFGVSKSVTMGGDNEKVDATTQELQDQTPEPSDDFADAGDWAGAGLISPASTTGDALRLGLFEASGDTDLFRLNAPRGGATRFQLTNPGGPAAVRLRVFDSTHAEVGVGAESDGVLSVSVTLTEGAEYFVLVESQNPASVGQYLLELAGPGPVDDHADAGDWSSAAEIMLDEDGGATSGGSLEVGGDTDLFRFTATVSGQLTITVSGSGAGYAGRFTVFSGAQGELGSGTASGGTGAAVAQISVSAGQTYYLLAGAVSDSATGAYTITLATVVQTTQDDAADAGEWSSGRTVSIVGSTGAFFVVGYLEMAGDTDLFRFVSNRTGRARLTLQHPAGAYSARLRAFGQDQTLIGDGAPGGALGVGSSLELELTSGLTYYILAEAMDGASVGVYTLEMANIDPAPVVVNDGHKAGWDQLISSTLIDGRLSVGFINFWGRPVIGTQQANGSWEYVDLIEQVPSLEGPTYTGDFLRWNDQRDGRAHIAMRSSDGLLLFTEDAELGWRVRNLTDELSNAHKPSADLSLFVDASGRANIAATNIVGDVIIYCQTVKQRADGIGWRWKYRNLTHRDLEPLEIEAPIIASEVTAWVTSLGSLNITFLDLDGNIQNFFKTRTDKGWTLANITQAAGTGVLVGELSVMQMRTRAVQITGTTEEGHVWATTFREGQGWTSRDLTERFETDPALVRSQVNYVNKAGVGFVAMIKENGNISLFRYAAAKNRWVYQDVNLTPPDFRNMMGRLEVTVDRETGEVNIIGTLDSARVVRWNWAPGRAWAFEDISYRLAAGA
ncbi:MAG: hypothetical protein IT438_00875 [Phycisphaerales bacterium]|nr:hypothetical protein [Phycisphaerales bacterium]